MNDVGTIERAYALAKSGQCRNVEEVRRKLREQGATQVDLHLSGKLIRRQLARMCREAAPGAAVPEPEAAE
jgi:hypothetical protein